MRFRSYDEDVLISVGMPIPEQREREMSSLIF